MRFPSFSCPALLAACLFGLAASPVHAGTRGMPVAVATAQRTVYEFAAYAAAGEDSTQAERAAEKRSGTVKPLP